jgi:hypothetical protein
MREQVSHSHTVEITGKILLLYFFHLYISKQQRERQNVLEGMIEGIARIYSALNFFMHAIFTHFVPFQMFAIRQVSKELVSYLYRPRVGQPSQRLFCNIIIYNTAVKITK